MRAFADPNVETVVLMVASQMGKTEAGFNVLGWMWETSPSPSIWVCPTQKLAYTVSRDRLNSMFKSCGDLWDALDPEYRRPGSLERFVHGNRFGLAWAGSATELASHPCKFVIIDERSRMGADSDGEGDPYRIVKARTKMYHGAKIGVFSTPTEEGLCPTYRLWLTGTKMRWCWQCPTCGDWVWPSLANAGYPEGAPYDVIAKEAWIACPGCARQIRDEDTDGLAKAYIPSTADEAGNLELHPGLEQVNSVVSYWATGFNSPTRGIGGAMAEYARASRDGIPEDVKASVNTEIGELYKPVGEGTSADHVLECQVPEIPEEDIGLVSLGVDVQDDCFYYVVRGWGLHQTSWLLDNGQIHGATEHLESYQPLSDLINDSYCGLKVQTAFIDSGFRAAAVYQFCRSNPRFHPTKGAGISKRAYWRTKVDVSPTGRPMSTLMLWNFDSDHWKMWLYARIRHPKDKPGGWYVPAGVSPDYAAQVTNEKWRISRGKREWYRTGTRDNHYLDCEINATVAAHAANLRAMRSIPVREPDGAPPPPQPDPPAPQSARQSPNRPPARRREWFGMR